MPMHTLRPRKRLTTRVAVVNVDVLAGTAPVHRSQVPCQFAGMGECYRTAPSSELIGLQCNNSATAVKEKLRASSLRWSWMAAPSAVIHDVLVVRQHHQSLPLKTMFEYLMFV